MVELDGTVDVTGADGPVPFLDLFEGRDELVPSRPTRAVVVPSPSRPRSSRRG